MLTIMIGIAGSGKSTYAKALAAKSNAEHISSDHYRAQFGTSEEDFSHEPAVWARLKQDVDAWLAAGCNVVFDATNLTRKARKDFIEIGKRYGKVDAVLIEVTAEEAIKRDSGRTRHVPPSVIQDMAVRLAQPTVEEGFDSIKIIRG